MSSNNQIIVCGFLNDEHEWVEYEDCSLIRCHNKRYGLIIKVYLTLRQTELRGLRMQSATTESKSYRRQSAQLGELEMLEHQLSKEFPEIKKICPPIIT